MTVLPPHARTGRGRYGLLLSLLLLSALSVATAQPLSVIRPAEASPAESDDQPAAAGMSEQALRALTLRDATGRALGPVTDLVFTTEAEGQRISHLIVDIGGVLGLAAHRVAVPYAALLLLPGDGQTTAIVPWTQTQLLAVPAWNRDDPATLGLRGAGPRPLGDAEAAADDLAAPGGEFPG